MQPSKNLTAILVGTGEFSFSEGATTVATSRSRGFLDFGNITAFTPKAEFKNEEHFGSYRGKRKRDRSINTEQKIEYQLKCDEWNHTTLAICFGAAATTGFTQTIKTAAAIDGWTFSSGAGASGTAKWYEITVSNARVRGITTLTLTTLTEGTDYEVDPILGRVRFLVSQTSAIAGAVTAPAIEAGTPEAFAGFTPGETPIRKGFGRLVCFDQDDDNKVVYDHVDFSCEVSLETGGEIDGQKPGELTIKVYVTDTVGTIYVRESNA